MFAPHIDALKELFIGSYGRDTEIRGASDVDLLARLPSSLFTQYDSYIGNGQSALLQAIRDSIRKTYSSTDVGGDGQVVVVRFSDGIKFEVVPAFVRTDGSYTYSRLQRRGVVEEDGSGP